MWVWALPGRAHSRCPTVVLPGDDLLFFVGDADALVDEIDEFLTGTRSGGIGDVLTMTVLFTDIEGFTE
jgi:hypothetical protein